jgi:phosphoserine phosphatase
VEQVPHVLNVIAETACELASELREFGAPAWLSDDRAFDIPLADDPQDALKRARALASGHAADINVVAAANRRKKLLVADMDSTIIACECLDEIANVAGFGARVAPITERAMRGEIAFEPALRQRAALLKGLPVSILDRVYAERVRLNPGAQQLVATMRRHGAITFLLSSGFTYFTRRVAAELRFDREQANVLLDDGVTLTGQVAEPVLGREAKLVALEKTVAELGIAFADSMAVGDGANDLAMIEHAGLGVAYHAKPIVAAAARVRIDHGDLTSLLYLQGYRDSEILCAAD